jgi:hypothetical protein
MTKIEYIDFIRNLLGGDAHRKDIEFAVDQAYQQYISLIPSNRVNDYNFLTKTYKDVPVSLDSDINKYYSDLPVPIIHLPEVNKGVRHINTMTGTDLQFYPMTEEEWELIGGSVSGSVHTLIGFITETNRVWYYNMDNTITEVRMRLAVPFSAFSDDEYVNMPGGASGDITQLTRNILLEAKPFETKNDYK